jgi:hypothetical protein
VNINGVEVRGDSIDDLLHDAERKKGAAEFATMMGHTTMAASFREEHRILLAEANRRDPKHEDPAWEEADV